MNDYPILDAYADGSVWKVWCVHCRRWHIHGAGPGHRAAHCDFTPKHPYRGYPHGYELRLAGKWEDRPQHVRGRRK